MSENNETQNIFARQNDDGNYLIINLETGDVVTRLELNEYPVDSELSTRYEHPEGIVFTIEQVQRNNIEIE